VTGTAAPSDRLAFIGLLLVALVVRLGFVAVMPREILWPDGREYVEVAHSLLAGRGYGLQTVRPPGYPTFIAAVWALTGPHLIALRVVEAVLSVVTAALIGLLGMRGFGRSAGLVAMTLAALHPVLAFLPATEYSESFVVLVCVGAYTAFFAALNRPRGDTPAWVTAGALLGIAMLTRPNVVALVPGLLSGVAIALRRVRRRIVRPVLLVLVTMALVVTPWTVRNHRVHGHWFFIATGGGHSLWLGSNDRTTGRAGSIMVPDSALDAELMRLPDEVTRDRRLGQLGIEWMKADPARALRMYAVRMSSLWALYPDTYTHNRFTNDAARWAQGLISVIVFMGALLALVRARDEPWVPPMIGAIVSFSLVNALFFMVLRYRMPFEPLLLLLAGLGWSRMGAPGPSRAG
jgi:4-amino-4-deoxy-L-arabinose transferase-like glycosyltransferase